MQINITGDRHGTLSALCLLLGSDARQISLPPDKLIPPHSQHRGHLPSCLSLLLMPTMPKLLLSRPYGLQWRASPWFITLGIIAIPYPRGDGC
jgi:hypothetical protein